MSSSRPFKKESLAHGIYWKKTFNIDGTTTHSNTFIPLNCKYLPSLSSE